MLENPAGKTNAALHHAANSTHTLPDPFIFVPITQQEAAKGRGAAKRIVRAHVTRIQHAKSSTLNGMQDLQQWTVRPYVHRESPSIRRKPRGITVAQQRRRASAPAGLESAAAEDASEQQTQLVASPRLPTGRRSEDPFWTLPVEYDPKLTPLLTHYIEHVVLEIPGLDGPFKELLQRHWLPLVKTDPAAMYAVLLTAASHLRAASPSKTRTSDVLTMKARALAEINNALISPKRATSDAVIGAVAKMAAYESVYGEPEIYVAHMKGLATMLKIRGGLSALGLEGTLEQMLVWLDINASYAVGRNPTFGSDEFPTVVSVTLPKPGTFKINPKIRRRLSAG